MSDIKRAATKDNKSEHSHNPESQDRVVVRELDKYRFSHEASYVTLDHPASQGFTVRAKG